MNYNEDLENNGLIFIYYISVQSITSRKIQPINVFAGHQCCYNVNARAITFAFEAISRTGGSDQHVCLLKGNAVILYSDPFEDKGRSPPRDRYGGHTSVTDSNPVADSCHSDLGHASLRAQSACSCTSSSC